MTRPRKELVNLQDTLFYHLTTRCVRRAFLCGFDQYSNTCYEHRRQFIVERVRLLSSIFSINICTYAIMSNHYHLVVKVDPKLPESWTIDDIILRWTSLFKGPILIQRYLQGDVKSPEELATVYEIAEVWRKRLSDISWFMKCLNEPIARQANKEDNVKGHFFEARYNSQALKTEQALLSAMAYVDLNPIRAKMAKTPENSDYTGLQERIRPQLNLHKAVADHISDENLRHFDLPLRPLLHFDESEKQVEQNGIPFTFNDYLTLVDTTGRIIRHGKRGSIHEKLAPILDRLKLENEHWMLDATAFEENYQRRFGERRRSRKNVAA